VVSSGGVVARGSAQKKFNDELNPGRPGTTGEHNEGEGGGGRWCGLQEKIGTRVDVAYVVKPANHG